MNKKNLLIIVAVVVGIGIILISLGWPPISKEDASGSFTKANKYKENTVKEGDVILNSELLADTNKTKKAIVDLVQFGDFALYVKSVLNQLWLPELNNFKGIPEINSAIDQINEFSSFIDNNNKTVQNTVVTFVEFYDDSKKPVNADVESQVKQFYNYATQFLIRDSIFEATIGSIDIALKGNIKKSKQIESLKNLRDRIVMDNFLYGLSVGDTTKIYYSSIQVLNNPKLLMKSLLDGQVKGQVAGYYANQSILNTGFTNKSDFVGAVNSALKSGIENGKNNSIYNFIGNNSPLFYCGNQYYFSFNQQKLNLIFSNDAVNMVKIIEGPGNNIALGTGFTNQMALGLLANPEYFKVIANQNVIQTVYWDNMVKLFNQTQIGMFNQTNLNGSALNFSQNINAFN